METALKRRSFSQGEPSVSRKALLGLCVVAMASACIATGFTQTQGYQRPPKPRSEVEVIKDGELTRPHQEVGTIHVRSGLGYRMGLDKLIDEAASRGCDALWKLQVIADYQRSTIGDSGEKTKEDDFTATCVIYVDPDAGSLDGGDGTPPPVEPKLPFHPGTPE